MDTDAFDDCTDHSILVERATSLWGFFISVSADKISPEGSFDEKIFKEDSWFLTQDDGTPLPEDRATNVPYRTSSYVRTRQEQKIKDGKLKKKVKIKSAVKIRDIDPEAFEFPIDDDIDSNLDCDIHPDTHRFTFKIKVDDLDDVVAFDTFADVLELFPSMANHFQLPPKTSLPERHSFVTHRFRWDAIMIPYVEISCDLDLRFHTHEEALSGTDPFKGEFSCKIDVLDNIARYQDVDEALNTLASIFTRFQSSIDKGSFPLAT